jgi:hypothetical protein
VAQNEDRPEFPRLLLCEGPEDRFFFHRLIQQRSIPSFHIWDAHGNRQFAGALRAYQISRPRTFRNFNRILIVGDNDETPDANFDSICQQIEAVFGAGSAPTARRNRTAGNPSIAVLMIPWDDRNGHLERLCVESAHWSNRTVGDETDHFLARLLADRWSESRKGKAWLRSNLAARCDSDPFIPLGRVFTDVRHHGLVPDHKSFDAIADYLTAFAS